MLNQAQVRTENPTQSFRVVAVSDNTNAFGLYGVVLVARDGEAWQVGLNHLRVQSFSRGSDVTIRVNGPERLWHEIGAEIPERIEDAPKEVLEEVYGEKTNA